MRRSGKRDRRRHDLHDAHRPRAQPNGTAPPAPHRHPPRLRPRPMRKSSSGPMVRSTASSRHEALPAPRPIRRSSKCRSRSASCEGPDYRAGAQSISQALRYTAGVFAEPNGAADFSSTFLKLRGFRTDAASELASSAVYSEVEPYGVERIEVLKGPSSGLYGSSGPGGLVNMTSSGHWTRRSAK